MPELSHTDWKQLAQKVSVPADAFIDGTETAAVSGERFACVNPATQEVLAQVAAGDAPDVDRAVTAARRSFEAGDWSRAPLARRKQVLLRFADLMTEHADELALLDSLDMGKRVVDAHELDLPFSASLFRYYAEAMDKLPGEVAPMDAGVTATITREPLGVVGAVVPWNYPVDMMAWKCAPALAAGNSVVLKPAEQSPLSAIRLARLLSEAGLPDGVFNVVPGYGETAGQALGLHPDVDCIAFTGSTAVAKKFLGYSGASNLKQVWPEAGGKSSALVFADAADLDRVADLICFDIFFNQGEVCSAHSRLLVQDSVHDELLQRIIDRLPGYQPGDPLDPDSGMGALVDLEHADRVMRHIERGRTEATLVAGGQRVTIGSSDAFVEPTVFDGAPAGSALFQEEVFGPVLAVSTFADEAEAVRLANGTAFGLAASVFTSDIGRAHRVSRNLVAGTVTVNSIDAFSAQTPFGGFKGSGFGRDLSLHALDKFTGQKTTWIAW